MAYVYAGILNWHVGIFPIKYLGVAISSSRLHVSKWVKKNLRKSLIYGRAISYQLKVDPP
jgi:hypothetical protein